MADELIRLFADDGGVVPFTQRSRDIANRQRASAAAREAVLNSAYWTTPVFGPQPDFGQRASDILPPPAEDLYGRDFYRRIVPEMSRTVLRYAAYVEARIDTVEHLKLSFLAGVPGDRDSERAREAVEAAFENVNECVTAMRGLGMQYEIGFKGLENVYGVMSRGEFRELIYPAEMIDRPESWFGFDYDRKCRFRGAPNDRAALEFKREHPEVPDMKVMFGRSGSLHTPYGKGYAEKAYPTVWAINEEYRKLRALTERGQYMPMVVTTPYIRGSAEFESLSREVFAQWKNAIVIPGVETPSGGPQFNMNTEGAYATANAIGEAILKIINRYEEQLGLLIQGSVASVAAQETGSYARDAVADNAKMYKAPSDAACKEAALNRGFVTPIMLLNFAALEREKWPRASIDSSFGEDLKMLMELIGFAVDRGMPVSWTAFSERTSIPIAEEGEPLLKPATSRAPAALVGPNGNPLDDSLKAFSEQRIVIQLKNGRTVEVDPDTEVLTKDMRLIRAAQLNRTGGEIIQAIRGIPPHILRAA